MSKAFSSKFFKLLGLSSNKRSMLAMVITWALNLFWLGINYFWNLAGITVLITVPIILLLIAIIALTAYLYWSIINVKGRDAPYANIVVGVIIAFTLLCFNYKFLDFMLSIAE